MTDTDDLRALPDDYINDVNASDIRRVCEWAADRIDDLEQDLFHLKKYLASSDRIAARRTAAWRPR